MQVAPLLLSILIFCCTFSLQVAESVDSAPSHQHYANSTLPNTCGPQALRRTHIVRFDVVLHNYCGQCLSGKYNEGDCKPLFDEKFFELKEYVEALASKCREFFSWKMLISFSVGKEDEGKCELHKEFLGKPISVDSSLLLTDSKNIFKHAELSQRNLLEKCCTESTIVINFFFSSMSTVSKKIDAKVVDHIKAQSVAQSIAICLQLSDGDYTNTCATFTQSFRSRPDIIVYSFKRDYPVGGDDHFRDIVSYLACNPSYKNAYPYEMVDEATGKSICQCVCPPGYQWKRMPNGQKACKRIPKQVENMCRWDKCYVVNVNDPDQGTCTKSGVFSQLEIPVPWDNYVVNRFNAQTGDMSSNKPHIEISLLKNSKVLWEKRYTWRQLSSEQELKAALDHLKFHKEGHHTVKISASDWHFTTSCSVDIHIQDNFRPTSAHVCPSSHKIRLNGVQVWPSFNEVGLATASVPLMQFRSYLNERRDDSCSPESNDCDVQVSKAIEFGAALSVKEIPFNMPYTEFNEHWGMSCADLAYLAAIDLSRMSTAEFKPRTKCWTLSNAFGEKVTSYPCPYDPSTITTSTCELDTKNKCEVTQCVKHYAKQIHEAECRIVASVAEESDEVLTALGLTGNENEIHIALTETTVGKDVGDGKFRTNLEDLIEISMNTTLFGRKQHFDYYDTACHGTKTALQEVVKCQYLIDGKATPWNYKGKNPFTFTNEQTTLVIECWTRLGNILREEVVIVLHPHEQLDVCGEFELRGFYQTIRNPHQRLPDQYCNVPKSDFAEITLKFDECMGQPHNRMSKKAHYEFDRMKCRLSYLDENTHEMQGSSVELFSNATAKKFVRRFAIDLQRYPTSAGTLVEIECDLEYHSATHKRIRNLQQCHKLLYLNDCDPPEFNEDLAKCTDRCKATSIRPYGSCAGNRVHFRSTGATLERTEAKCCPECNTPDNVYKCFALADKVVDKDAIGRCEPEIILPATYKALLVQHATNRPMAFYGVLSTCLLAVGFLVRMQFSRSSEDDLSEDYYLLM